MAYRVAIFRSKSIERYAVRLRSRRHFQREYEKILFLGLFIIMVSAIVA